MRRILFALFAIEVLSFAAYNLPYVHIVVFTALCVITAILSIKKLLYGVLILLAELVIGSKGYLFAVSIAGFPISIRIALFLIVFAAYIIWIIRDRKIDFFHWPLWKAYAAVIAIIALGAFIGYMRGNTLGNIFFDANGYLYLGLIGPATQAIKSRTDVLQIYGVFIAAAIAIIIKTLILLFIFSKSNLWPFSASGIYRWIRDSGVGEITKRPSGFYRIFFQSHIYTVFLFFFIGTWFALHQKIKPYKAYVLFALSFLTVFLVYSRSFWVGSVATLMIAFVWLWLGEKTPFKKVVMIGGILVLTFACNYIVALGIINFPIPGTGRVGAGALLTERTTNIANEDAASSRISLLKPLWHAGIQHPILGSGLGTTVTYISSDPRVLETHPDGKYTTFAFEWGYLDVLLKFGVLGLAAYAFLFVLLFRYAYRRIRATANEPQSAKHIETLGLILTLLALLGTHFFTPYLNHPLGIGWVVLCSIILSSTHTYDDIS